jgi:hypothetical protein
MVNVDSTLRTVYKNDMFPLSPTISEKDLEAVFSDILLTVGTDQFAVDKGDLELNESICSDGDIKFGKCNSSSVKFTLADVIEDIKGREFALNQTVISGSTTYPMPLGLFKVDSANKQDDLRFKDVIAYDRMKRVDTEVAPWYRSLFPIGTEIYTLAQFRTSFLAYVGLPEDTSKLPLPNDSMAVTKTIEPESLDGRAVIEAIEEINGCFGRIDRSGLFTHVVLKPAYGLYPTNDLYPSDTLYPVSETDTTYTQPDLINEITTADMRRYIRFEEYTVKEIDKLIIRTDEEDFGAIIGTGTNAYIIQGNFLLYGKSAAELQIIGTNAYGYMAKRPYRPYESDNIGLPYLEPGDMLKFDQTDPVIGYMLNRTLSGIQSLRDNYAATGSQEREQRTDTNTEIKMLQSRTLKIKKDVDGVLIEVEDLRQDTSTAIEHLSNQIVLKVNTAGNIGIISLDGDPETELTQIKLKADNISLEGIVTANNNFKVMLDGSIEAVNGKFSGQISGAKYYLTLDEANSAIIGTDGTSEYNVVSYKNTSVPEWGYYQRYIVAGDTGIGYWVSGNTCVIRASDRVAIQAYNPVSLTSHRNGAYYGVSIDGYKFYPNTDGNIALGDNFNAWSSFYTKNITLKSGGTLGLFGSSPVSQKTVTKLSTSATLADVINKMNALLDAIGNSTGYGLIDL